MLNNKITVANTGQPMVMAMSDDEQEVLYKTLLTRIITIANKQEANNLIQRG